VYALGRYSLIAVCLALFLSTAAPAQSREEATLQQAAAVLNEIMAVKAMRIPESLLADAHGIAIIPGVVKGGFVIGGRYGRGVVLVRDDSGAWHPPAFVALTGGSVGFQAGVQATDVILVFKTRKSIEGLMQGKFTLGADAAVAAGPVGRQASAATDAKLKAEIYSYSRSRGLFAGVSFDGSVLQIDPGAAARYYRTTVGGRPTQLPDSAGKLMQQVAQFAAQGGREGSASMADSATGSEAAGDESPHLAERLTVSWTNLSALLDEQWQQYLALPAELFEGGQPSFEAVQSVLARYEAVAGDPRYRVLSQRPEFQVTHQGLKQLAEEVKPQAQNRLQLPPPPQ